MEFDLLFLCIFYLSLFTIGKLFVICFVCVVVEVGSVI
jgi:hypothetical protein